MPQGPEDRRWWRGVLDRVVRATRGSDAAEDYLHTAFLRLWAALSTPVLILGIGVLLTHPSLATLSAFASFLAVVATVEAAARGRIRLFLIVLAAAAVGLGSAAGVVLALLSNWQAALAVLLAVTGLVLLALNLHELVGSTGQRQRATPAGADPS